MEKNPIQILAKVLPNMMRAVLNVPKSEAQDGQALGGITNDIAKYLNAEICSIFRVNEKGNALLLTEAHGYDNKVIGAEHDLEKGLTGKIFKEQVELILNYCVQDPDLGWIGKFIQNFNHTVGLY